MPRAGWYWRGSYTQQAASFPSAGVDAIHPECGDEGFAVELPASRWPAARVCRTAAREGYADEGPAALRLSGRAARPGGRRGEDLLSACSARVYAPDAARSSKGLRG